MWWRRTGRLAWLIAVLAMAPAVASERIVEFRSEMTVHADASMSVAETIVVIAAGQLIRRGIYRDFPTDYHDRLGNRYRVAFEVQGVTRNGEPEPFHAERHGNGVRLYIGRPNVLVEHGRQVYVIRYRTDRQLGHFDTHDELYWNVTGNGWDLPIEQASAVVHLPGPVPLEELRVDAYTGLQGSREQDWTAGRLGDAVVIAATRPLGPREGLTIGIGWTKGHVAVPGRAERVARLLADNRGLLLSLAGLAVVLAYLVWAWLRYGRDPKSGVIFPHYEPPAGYSPAAARFIMRMGYDDRAFAAALLSLAVKGHLEIEDQDGEYTLSRRPAEEALAPGERALLAVLFDSGGTIALRRENHQRLAAAKRAHSRSLERDYLKTYFFRNSMLLGPSLLATAILAMAIGLLDGFRPLVVVVFGLMILAHLVFAHLLKAPTARGRLLLDRLEGFRMYLEVAEKDELNLRNPPQRTPELFERYLPYALALGVEQKWAERFAGVFRGLEQAGGGVHSPLWYRGSFDPGRIGRFAAGIGAGLTSAIASASSPPGSSSGGGGGGSSGGGGGGGGGGGW